MRRWPLLLSCTLLFSLFLGGYSFLQSHYQAKFATQTVRFHQCFDKSHQLKLEALYLVRLSQYDESIQAFNLARDFYSYCHDFLPTSLGAWFDTSQKFHALKYLFLTDYADLFYQFALFQGENLNPQKDLKLAIGAAQQAIHYITKACGLKGQDSCLAQKQTYLTFLGDNYRLVQNYRKALDLFKKADDTNPDNPTNLSFWGLTLYETGAKDEALTKWKLALKKDPSAPANLMMQQLGLY